MPTKTGKDADTRARLLTAAESLLLDTQYDDVSVRAICTAADANVAAVHYHFGSKKALVTALLEDRLAPSWAQPLAQLAHADAPLPDYVDAVVQPFTALVADPIGRCHLRLLARLALRYDETGWSARWFTLESWIPVLVAHRPELEAKEAGRRWLLAFQLVLLHFSADRVPSPASTETLRAFVTAGLTA